MMTWKLLRWFKCTVRAENSWSIKRNKEKNEHYLNSHCWELTTFGFQWRKPEESLVWTAGTRSRSENTGVYTCQGASSGVLQASDQKRPSLRPASGPRCSRCVWHCLSLPPRVTKMLKRQSSRQYLKSVRQDSRRTETKDVKVVVDEEMGQTPLSLQGTQVCCPQLTNHQQRTLKQTQNFWAENLGQCD